MDADAIESACRVVEDGRRAAIALTVEEIMAIAGALVLAVAELNREPAGAGETGESEDAGE